MTFAGKKLQDIYDSGASLLAELEAKVGDNLSHAKDAHIARFRSNVEASAEKVKSSSHSLQAELSQNVDVSLEKLRKATEQEIKECQTHSLQMVAELSNLSDRLKLSIAALKQSYHENVDHIGTGFSDRYTNALEHSKLELEKHDFGSSKNLREHGMNLSATLQQKLDKTLWESRGEEKQVSATLFKSYMQKASAIDTQFGNLMQQLSTEFNSVYQIIEASMKRSETELEDSAKHLLAKVDEQASRVEERVSQHFQSTSEGHNKKLDGDLASVADDLSAVHDATTERLGQSTEKLVQSLGAGAAQAHKALDERCQEVKGKIGSELSTFKSRLDERVTAGTALNRTLEGDKDEILSSVQNEIVSIRDSFEQRIVSLINDAASRLGGIANDAEREILSAQRQCEDVLNRSGNETQREIEEQVAKFLNLVAQHRAAALDDITKAADAPSQSEKK
jgi:hypothetical protein